MSCARPALLERRPGNLRYLWNDVAMRENGGISKTKLLAFVRSHDWKAIDSAITRQPELLDYRTKRGENYLHLCCGVDFSKHDLRAVNGIKSADVLIGAGLDINREAFREGEWKATPLWYAIARGNNLNLAKHLLTQGATPEYCLWAAAYNNNSAAIRLLADSGATIDVTHGGDTPLLFAVRWSRFAAAKTLLQCGANPNYQDESGNTSLHYALKKRSNAANICMLLESGARRDLLNRDGVTAKSLLERSRDVRYRELA